MENTKVFSVNEINRFIKSVLEESPLLKDVRVRGEISNFYHQPRSGHMYFDLKSRDSKLKCVSFRNMNLSFRFMPKDGMNVIARGYVTTYGVRSEYQIIVKDIQHYGIGDLHEEFERLKAKLLGEGLFDSVHKGTIPVFPKKIGVVSGAESAALHDILKIIKRRYPCVELLIVPTIVQGAYAEGSIISSLDILNKMDDIDVIILARGGGSLEDLWAFNLESVARTVFHSKIPIVTGIGHQTDFTLCDFVADHRRPTPSAAAEKTVPNSQDLLQRVDELKRTAVTIIRKSLENERFKFDTYSGHILLKEPERLIVRPTQYLDEMHNRLVRTASIMLHRFRDDLRIHDRGVVFQRPYDHIEDLYRRLIQSFIDLNTYFRVRFQNFRERGQVYGRSILQNAPMKKISQLEDKRRSNHVLIRQNMNNMLKFRNKSVNNLSGLIRSLSPYNVLDRGYAVVLNEDKRIITNANKTSLGEMIEVRFRSSGLKAEVKEKEVDLDD